MQEFLDRIVEDHGSLDLEWLRDVPPQDTKYAKKFYIYLNKEKFIFCKANNSYNNYLKVLSFYFAAPRDFLMSIYGIGLKSTECIRLLTLRHVAFPVSKLSAYI